MFTLNLFMSERAYLRWWNSSQKNNNRRIQKCDCLFCDFVGIAIFMIKTNQKPTEKCNYLVVKNMNCVYWVFLGQSKHNAQCDMGMCFDLSQTQCSLVFWILEFEIIVTILSLNKLLKYFKLENITLCVKFSIGSETLSSKNDWVFKRKLIQLYGLIWRN